ncbi:hypothetical protein EJ06DRAFT_582026 [Trichodelitschia bisporula]|uniref:Uncharacterized protein n=1 Tax=Trichodelitschia bisporula TaxID=703511 RepID=A0A6G1HYU2_9PEZI|nr:hypothetical protein EJ06DRAFT_582026 [Trichodelitschia bisporula]
MHPLLLALLPLAAALDKPTGFPTGPPGGFPTAWTGDHGMPAWVPKDHPSAPPAPAAAPAPPSAPSPAPPAGHPVPAPPAPTPACPSQPFTPLLMLHGPPTQCPGGFQQVGQGGQSGCCPLGASIAQVPGGGWGCCGGCGVCSGGSGLGGTPDWHLDQGGSLVVDGLGQYPFVNGQQGITFTPTSTSVSCGAAYNGQQNVQGCNTILFGPNGQVATVTDAAYLGAAGVNGVGGYGAGPVTFYGTSTSVFCQTYGAQTSCTTQSYIAATSTWWGAAAAVTPGVGRAAVGGLVAGVWAVGAMVL